MTGNYRVSSIAEVETNERNKGPRVGRLPEWASYWGQLHPPCQVAIPQPFSTANKWRDAGARRPVASLRVTVLTRPLGSDRPQF